MEDNTTKKRRLSHSPITDECDLHKRKKVDRTRKSRISIDMDELLLENQRLKLENQRHKLEIELLKKESARSEKNNDKHRCLLDYQGGLAKNKM